MMFTGWADYKIVVFTGGVDYRVIHVQDYMYDVHRRGRLQSYTRLVFEEG